MIRNFVRNALEVASQVSVCGGQSSCDKSWTQQLNTHSFQGNEAPYLELTAHFLPTPTTPIPELTSLTTLLQALIANITLLQPAHHSSLIKAILNLPWASAGDDAFARVYTAFVGVLCSAKTEWISEVVNMAVKGLTWRKPFSMCTSIRRYPLG